jgi:ABC-type sugar transport system ATPase subunit
MTERDGRLSAVTGTGTPDGAPPAIETAGLSKRYRRATALSDCSVTVPEGRISALVGPNGAGKPNIGF